MFLKTPEHSAIENAIESGKPAIVAAGPGSGKTTTISAMIIPALLKAGKKGGAIAFNGKNAKALDVAINRPLYVACATTHSTLLKCLKTKVFGLRVQVESKGGFYKGRMVKPTIDKMVSLVPLVFPPTEEGKKENYALALKLVTLMKANAFGIAGYPEINDKDAIRAIIAEHALGMNEDVFSFNECEDENKVEKAIDHAILLMKASIENYATANYDDMTYMAIKLNAELPSWDFLVYDEAQDIKPIEFEFIKRMAAKGCQIITVGDSYQAINHFTGCMADSLGSIADLLNVDKLPLRTSYRASHVAAEYANSIFPNSVIPWSGAKQGSVEHTTKESLHEHVASMDFNSGILSRTHKHLMVMAMKLLAQKREFTYKGIVELVQRMEKMLWHSAKNSKNLGLMRQSLTEYQANLEDKHTKENGQLPHWVITNGETTEALCLLLAQCEGEGGDYECVKYYLKTLADSEKVSSGPTLSTIHSAKGMQWENVYLVGPLQSSLVKSEQQVFAEKCLEYVAYSRSSDKIIFVSDEE